MEKAGIKRITHSALTEKINRLETRYDFLKTFNIGRSFRGKNIQAVCFGEGEDIFLYVGAHHGAEGITSGVLLRYIEEMCRLISQNGKIGGGEAKYLLKQKRVMVIPMLNPDGVELSVNGCSEADPMYPRLIRMNGSDDFTRWQANGRGVDLNHNYNSGFAEYKRLEKEMGIGFGASSLYSGEYPESEAEVACLCRFLRSARVVNVVTLHTQGEEIYYSSNGKFLKEGYKNAIIASRLTGYKISTPTGTASYGGLLDYLTEKTEIPCLTLECGKGQNPLPPRDEVMIYGRLREFLLSAPFCLATANR